MRILLNLLLLGALCFPSFLLASIGKVSLLKGNSVAVRANQTLTLSNGMDIEEKDTIKTAKDAQIQLIFEDKTVITLGSESEFSIEEYLNDTKNPKAKFKFNHGTFKSITGQIGKTAPENFILETKTATIGIRGTTVVGKLDKDSDKIGCTQGLIAVSAIGSSDFILVPAGKMTFIVPGQNPTLPTDIQMRDLAGAKGADGHPKNGPPPPPRNSFDKANETTQLTRITDISDTLKENPSSLTSTLYADTIFSQFAIHTTLYSDYSSDATLEGFTSKQLADGTASFSSDLSITLDKNTKSLTVSSTPLTLDALTTNLSSAYTQDDRFAVLAHSGGATPAIQKYLLATTYDFQVNDYVSWAIGAMIIKQIRHTPPFHSIHG